MKPSSSSKESIRSIETYATAANHPMPAILKARRVVLLSGLFGVRRSRDRCISCNVMFFQQLFFKNA